MSSIPADAFVPSSDRPLRLRRRADVRRESQRWQGQSCWVLKDPVRLQYFRFHEQEYALWLMMDGNVSLGDLKDAFDDRFAPDAITLEELHRFTTMLHQNNLVVSTVPGQGAELFRRGRRNQWKKFTASMSNVLSIRFRGIDPERVLNWLHPKIGWMFSLPMVLTVLAFGLAALLLIAVRFETFQAKLPAFDNFFTIENAMWMWLVLGSTKVLHEFGHGLTCKRFGGECHEMGIMLLVLTPCLYCDASDSWLLPSKWKRMAIGAGGMYVELSLATAATFLWWFSEPGLLHHLSLNVMFVCSVSTIIFNGNPLLRYDGYYILADFLEIPNLQRKSQQILTRQLGWLCLGLEKPHDAFLPKRKQFLFASFCVASNVYRWFVLFSILFFLNRFLEPYGLKAVGQSIAMFAIGGMVLRPAWSLWKFLSTPGRLRQVKPLRVVATVIVLGIVLAGIAAIPLPHSVQAVVAVEPRDARRAFVETSGKIVKLFVAPGNWVEKGAPLAQLESPELESVIAKLQAQHDEQKVQVDVLRTRSFHEPNAGLQLPYAKETLHNLNEQLKKREEEQDRLTLTAPISGTVLPPPSVPGGSRTGEAAMNWSGTPFDERNENVHLEAGSLLCLIGDPTQLDAVLIIDQSEVEFVRKGQAAEIQLDQSSGALIRGEIAEVSRQAMEFAPRQVTGDAGGRLATEKDGEGRDRPLTPSYQARVPMDDSEGALRDGLRGRAKIHVGYRTLGAWLVRVFRETFHFKL
ncbi:MAG: efflux RND transporter periplasmic adaptor subunit [Planctomycetales bacterium]